MIPREILKKIRQIELRTDRVVTEFAVGARASARFIARVVGAIERNGSFNPGGMLKRGERRAAAASEPGCVRIPTGFRLKAQGCAAGTTLGHLPANIINRNAVADLFSFSQGSSFLATPGWRTQSLWDCPNRANSSFNLHPSSFSPA